MIKHDITDDFRLNTRFQIFCLFIKNFLDTANRYADLPHIGKDSAQLTDWPDNHADVSQKDKEGTYTQLLRHCKLNTEDNHDQNLYHAD